MSQAMPNPDYPFEIIHQKCPNFKAKMGIILGSGLGGLADQLEQVTRIPYSELPGFSQCTVAGHSGVLHLGYLHGLPVACLQGRAHFYEGVDRQAFFTLVRTLKLIGCEQLIATNAAGSLRTDVPVGSVVLIKDHINFMGFNPLVGPNDSDFGPRFMSMENAYDAEIRQKFKLIAAQHQVDLPEGTYIAVSGPSFETPAEIRAFQILGADVVGMSTVPEVIVARHCGLKVATLSAISNLAAGLNPEELSHEVTLAGAKLAAEKLSLLIHGYIKEYGHE